jgi:glycosyltransferase involved in cell wall biosynthesis
LVVTPRLTGRTVLFVAGEFPPIKTIGRLRSTKFIEHLRDDGWTPIVLSIQPNPGMPGYDPVLEAEVPAGVEVIRAPWLSVETQVVDAIKRLIGHRGSDRLRGHSMSSGPFHEPTASSATIDPYWSPKALGTGAFKWVVRNWVNIPDDYGRWANQGLALARNLCQTRQIDVVLTSLPPFSAAKIGYRLKKEFGIPWVADYRDLWVGDVLREWVGPVRRRIEEALERRYMRAADAIVAVSEQKTEFLKVHLADSRAVRMTLTNGYDPEIFAPYLAEPRAVDDHIDFVFTGRLFKNRRGYAFAEALGQLAKRQPDLRQRVRVHILGGVAPEIRARYDEILARYDLTAVYDFAGDISYHDAMRAQVQADYLLLIVDTGTTSSGVIPGKLFEYVAARRPIFALTDPGATQEIIERGRLGAVVPAENVAACRAALSNWLGHEVPVRLDADRQYLGQFDRRAISTRLGELLAQLIQRTPVPVVGPIRTS